MFLGTIPPPLRSIVAETVGSWPDQHELYVACCGNFTIERSVQHLGLALHSSDVSIYTSAIGRWLTGQPVGIALREESREQLGWIEQYLDDGIGTVATMMLGTRFLGSLGKAGAWHERTVRGWRSQFPAVHAQTVEKLARTDFKIASYTAIDVRELLWGIPPDAPLASFPPFYCLDVDELVLTDDLRWVRAGDLRMGDGLLAFDEEPTGRCRRWRWSRVEASESRVAPRMRVTLSNGDSVVTTPNHPWLARRRLGDRLHWVCSEDLLGHQVERLVEPWTRDETYDAGWLAGMFDGEGSIYLNPSTAKLGIAQKVGATADWFESRMKDRGHAVGCYPRHGEVNGYEVGGGMQELLRCLGELRPERLIARFRAQDVSLRTVRGRGEYATVLSVEPLEPGPIQMLATSTRTYVGAGYPMHNSGGYETLWKPLDTHFTWDAPDYQILSESDVTSLVEKMADRPYWVLATNHEVESLSDHYRGLVKATNRGAPHYVYGTIGHSRLATPRQKLEPVLQPRLKPGEPIGDRLALAPLRDGQLNTLRSQYLNPRIAPGQCDVAFAVLCDGRLIGVIGYSLQGGPAARPGWAYLMTDFAVAPTDYPRLLKLVVLAALSAEAKHLLQRAWSRKYVGVATTAFSNNPVSMKYRGILALDKRGESKDPGWKYALNYSAPLGEHTLAEALDVWKQKWGAPRVAQEA